MICKYSWFIKASNALCGVSSRIQPGMKERKDKKQKPSFFLSTEKRRRKNDKLRSHSLVKALFHLEIEENKNRLQKKNDIVFTHIFSLLFLCFSIFHEENKATWSFPTSKSKHFHLFIPSHPVNLSISLTGGKEIKRDVPSNGEWKGHLAHN